MNQIQFLVIASAITFLCGCASIRTDSSNPSLQSPLTTASEKLGFNLEMGSSDRIKFTDDASARPPTIALEHSRSNDFRTYLAYGINERFDVSAGLTSSVGINLTSRFRLMGDSNSTWATAGTLFFSYDSSSKSGDQNGEFGPAGFNWNADASSTLSALGIALGYRVSENALIILNAGVGQTQAKLKIKQDPGSGDPGGSYTSETKAPLHNLGLGVAFGRQTLFTLGAMYTHKKWNDSALGDTSTTHAILKIEFN